MVVKTEKEILNIFCDELYGHYIPEGTEFARDLKNSIEFKKYLWQYRKKEFLYEFKRFVSIFNIKKWYKYIFQGKEVK